MAQFDVHRVADGKALVLDCQSDLLSHIATRFVVPLIAPEEVASPFKRLNPAFTIEGRDYLMLTQAALAIDRRDLGDIVGSFGNRRSDIVGALDLLITGV